MDCIFPSSIAGTAGVAGLVPQPAGAYILVVQLLLLLEAGSLAVYGATAAFIPGTGASYAALLTGNPAAGGLLPFLMFALTDAGIIANYQGRNLSEEDGLLTVMLLLHSITMVSS
jgi:hypothetical protein